MEPGSSSFIADLRAATAAAHEALDRGLDLLGAGLTQERYIAFLAGSLAALEPLEESLATLSALESVPYRARAPRLRADLTALGVNNVATATADSPHLTSVAAALGARYVVEGSALGGAVLARGLAPALELDDAELGYLTLYGPDLGAHWRAFVSELERWGKSATLEMRAEACDTARAVFASYQAAFERAGAFRSHS